MSCRKELRVGSLAGTGGTACRPSTETGPEARPKATVAAGSGSRQPPFRPWNAAVTHPGFHLWQRLRRGRCPRLAGCVAGGGHGARGKRRPRTSKGGNSKSRFISRESHAVRRTRPNPVGDERPRIQGGTSLAEPIRVSRLQV